MYASTKNQIRSKRAAALWAVFVLLTVGMDSHPGAAETESFVHGLDDPLGRLYDISQRDGLEAARFFAERHGIFMQGDLVQVVAEAEPTDTVFDVQAVVSAAGQAVFDLGGQVETIHRHQIQNLIPLDSLRALAENAAVRHVRLPLKPILLTVSEGVTRTGADLWQNMQAYRGGGASVKVCVLDLGFQGYEALIGSELPDNTQAVSFRSDGDIEAGIPHGTACAEVIHDMAPDVSLYLVNYSTDVEHHNAVEWIIEQGMNIISYSQGWLSAGAGDGTGPICEDVNKVHQAGIVWVSAAGNSGEQHWHGLYKDLDLDTWHEFDQKGEKDSQYCAFWVEKGDRYSVWLNWDDWGTWNGSSYEGAQGNDYDLYLYDKNLDLMENSVIRQTLGAPPVEGVTVSAKSQGWRYIRIKKRTSQRNCRLELFFIKVSQLEHVEPYGSINVPADSPHAVAVGAVDWGNDSFHSYTSRGPTLDRRIKPDLSAPSGVSTQTYGKFSFWGTSASTAHVAGAIAILKQKTLYSYEQILEMLKTRVVDLGTPGRDNLFGEGRLNLIK